MNTESLTKAMMPGYFINSESPAIQHFARTNQGDDDNPNSIASALYLAVRDQVIYDPYCIRPDPVSFQASAVLQSGKGHCVGKAVLYAAVLRASGIPARIGFADVKNHLTTPRLRMLMGTDMFYHHGYAEAWLNDQWVKATPAFNLSLCEKFGIRPLEFNGVEDSIFHAFDREGRQHMEYIKDHGAYYDLPFDEMIAVYRRYYPAIFEVGANKSNESFEEEAVRPEL
ncbi:transglutaminase family protein [Zhongshania sp.]|uniref:transglutaminase-like domain-containing protein n=1 Tax=Zhongshania sp. TaxID=1971902 RepID=UPI003564B8F8